MAQRPEFWILRRFLTNEVLPYRGTILLACLLMVVAALATTASAWILQFVIDDLFVKKQISLIWPIAFGIVGIYIVKALATYGYSLCLASVSAKLSAQMRRVVSKKLMAQDIAYHDQVETADMVNRISNVTKSAGQLVSLITTSAMRDLLTVAFLIVFMVYQNGKLTIITFMIAPPVIFSVTMMTRRIRGSVAREFQGTSDFMQLLTERLSGIRVVKSSQAEQSTNTLLGSSIKNLQKQAFKIARITAISSPLMEMLGGMAVAGIIVYAGFSISSGMTTAGEIMAFITAFIYAYEPVKRLASLRVSLVNYLVPLGFYYELAERETPQTFGTEILPDTELSIEFDKVEFSYGEDNLPALKQVSFIAPKGKTTALVGRSGSGKSTIFSILQRFYDPKAGMVKINGINTADLSQEALRGAIAYIPQDAQIFTGTIADNIALGCENAPIEDIEQAANDAYLGEVISKLPEGLNTIIGDGQATLSGGQLQRLAIARAILKNSPILLLDEATSALDSEAESKIQKALEKASQSKTVLVIAHRLATIRNADQILVLDQGEVVESGTHSALLKGNGIYAMLDGLQNKNGNSNSAKSFLSALFKK